MLFTPQSSRRRKNLLMHNAEAATVFEIDADDGPGIDVSETGGDLDLQQRFAAECGVPNGLKIVVRGANGRLREQAVPGPFAVIGADPDCDVQIDAPGVSGRQAFVLSFHERVFACDLAGPTGTRHHGRLITKTWLKDGNSLEFSDAGITVAEPAGGESPAKPSGPRAEVELLFGGGRQSYRLKGEVLLFGRDSRCKLQCRHESVSPVHGAIVCTPDGVWLVDFATPEGVILDGIAVRLAPLKDGSVLTLGDNEIEVRMPSASPAVAPPAAAAPQGAVSEDFVLEVLERFQDSQRQLLDEMRSWTKDFAHAIVDAQHAQSQQLQGERQEMRRDFVELMKVMSQRLPGSGPAQPARRAVAQPARPDQRLPAPPPQLPSPAVAPTADADERLANASEPEELRRRLQAVEEHLDAQQGWLGSLLRRSPR